MYLHKGEGVNSLAAKIGEEVDESFNNVKLLELVKNISVLRIRIRSDPVFLGHPDPDPYFENRIRGPVY